MAEVPGVREALAQLAPGLQGLELALRSGESLGGELLGFDGTVVRLLTPGGQEEIEADEVIGVFATDPTDGPE